jgi:uncharacterized protein (DUF952 family)
MALIYKILTRELWREAQALGAFRGAPIDRADGYIHFSAGDQVRETAAKHFAGQRDLLLVSIDSQKLGSALKWEKSRGGALFPHLYAPLDLGAVVAVAELPIGGDGQHDFAGLLP